MPPKKKVGDNSAEAEPSQLDKAVEMTEQQFSSMLLNSLRHNEEVKSCVANIVRSRETDVYTAVVKCLRQGHDDITSSIGMYLFLGHVAS
jgi:hypothetical protein